MQEKWIHWQPIPKNSKQYHLESYSTNYENGLQFIIIDDNHKKISITLSGYICSYRITNESFFMETLIFLKTNYGENYYINNKFFIIENSEYLEWIKKQVDPIAYEVYKFKHYCIFTSNEIIDIISNYEPEVKYIQ